MSIRTRLQNIVIAIGSIPQLMIRFISNVITPITRIFSPTDDNYPSTGVQPFEGDPADKKRSEI